MSFWYELGFDDLAKMPMTAMQAYLDRLPARMAELKLAMADVVSIPNMKASDRKSALNAWEREANVQALEAVRVAPRGALKLMGIGVKRQPPSSPDGDTSPVSAKQGKDGPPVSEADIPPNTGKSPDI